MCLWSSQRSCFLLLSIPQLPMSISMCHPIMFFYCRLLTSLKQIILWPLELMVYFHVTSIGNRACSAFPVLKYFRRQNSPDGRILLTQTPIQKAVLIMNILYWNILLKVAQRGRIFIFFNSCCSSSSELSNGHGVFRASKQKIWDKGPRCRISCYNLNQMPLHAASLKISQLRYCSQPRWWPASRLSISKTNKPDSSHSKSLALQLTYLTAELRRGMFHLLLLQ